MKLISLYVALVSILAFSSCKKDEDKLSTADGKWTYTTPDSKMKIEFELVKTTDGYDVKNSKLTVDGKVADPTITIPDKVTSPTFTSLRFSANDAKLVQPFYILFTTGKISSDFKQIEISTVEYSFPYGTINQLSSVVIVRA